MDSATVKDMFAMGVTATLAYGIFTVFAALV